MSTEDIKQNAKSLYWHLVERAVEAGAELGGEGARFFQLPDDFVLAELTANLPSSLSKNQCESVARYLVTIGLRRTEGKRRETRHFVRVDSAALESMDYSYEYVGAVASPPEPDPAGSEDIVAVMPFNLEEFGRALVAACEDAEKLRRLVSDLQAKLEESEADGAFWRDMAKALQGELRVAKEALRLSNQTIAPETTTRMMEALAALQEALGSSTNS